jgi:hypothetical protein
MHAYDPLDAPNPDEWLAVGKLERIDAIEAYHTQGAVELPDARTHAVFHAIIENQLALRLAPVCDALARLLRDGLDRPEAIHAIASVLAEHMFDLHRGRITDQPNKRYFKHCPMGFESERGA